MVLLFLKNNLKKLLAVLIISIFTIFFINTLSTQNIYSGIFIDGIDVSNMEKEEAKNMLISKTKEVLKNNNFILEFKEKKWPISLSEIMYSINYDIAIDQAYNTCRDGNIFVRFYNVWQLKAKNLNIASKVVFNEVKLREKLMGIGKEIYVKEENMIIDNNINKIIVIKEIEGISIDLENTLYMVKNKLLNKDMSKQSIKVVYSKPDKTFEQIKDVKDEIAVYSTPILNNNVNRLDNIKLSCIRINNCIVMPNEVFSFDKTILPRTIKNGYKEAAMIVGGKMVNGIGGGICQVASTLHASVLLARLSIVERQKHSRTVSYIKPGLDATIAENMIDFKFKNTSKKPIIIKTDANDKRVLIKIFGAKEGKEKYKLVSKIIEEIQPLPEKILINESINEERKVIISPMVGVRVLVYLEKYTKTMEFITQKLLHEDKYKPIQGVIEVNPRFKYDNEISENFIIDD